MAITLQDNHYVFVTKYRKPLLEVEAVKMQCYGIFRSICETKGWNEIAIKIMDEHLHLLLGRPRTVTESYVAFQLKGASSRELRKNFKFLKGESKYAFWAPNFHVGSVGPNDLEHTEKYIENQEIAYQKDNNKASYWNGKGAPEGSWPRAPEVVIRRTTPVYDKVDKPYKFFSLS